MSAVNNKPEWGLKLFGNVRKWSSSIGGDNPSVRMVEWGVSIGRLSYYEEKFVERAYFSHVAWLNFMGFAYERYEDGMGRGLNPLVMPSVYVNESVGGLDNTLYYGQASMSSMQLENVSLWNENSVLDLLAKVPKFYGKVDTYNKKHERLLNLKSSYLDDLIRWLYALHNLGVYPYVERREKDSGADRLYPLTANYRFDAANLASWIDDTNWLIQEQKEKAAAAATQESMPVNA